MTLNFKKIFARKAKEIAAQVDEGERLLDDAQDKLCKLKCSSKASILRKEIADLINNLSRNQIKIGENQYYDSLKKDYVENANRITVQLEGILNELCELAERGDR